MAAQKLAHVEGLTMRRTDKLITSPAGIDAILKKAQTCHIATAHGNHPYVVPFFYGYKNNIIYVHCATEGKMLKRLKDNPRVCIEVSLEVEIVPHPKPRHWTGKYRSVIGYGKAIVVANPKRKEEALDLIMRHYGSRFTAGGHPDATEAMRKTTVLQIQLKRVTGKASV